MSDLSVADNDRYGFPVLMTRCVHCWLLRVSLIAVLIVSLPAAAWVYPTQPAATPGGNACLRADTPPEPPPRGAVLWATPDSKSADPNTLILAFGQPFGPELAACQHMLGALRTITVAKGGALLVQSSDGWTIPWGAVNVGLSDPPPRTFSPRRSVVGSPGVLAG